MHISEPTTDFVRRSIARDLSTRVADAELLLRLALEGSPSQCITQAGMTRHEVIQCALALADEIDVVLAYPELAERVNERADRVRSRRRLQMARLKAVS